MKPLNIAVIGTNFISDRFCEAALAVRGVMITAVLSRAVERGREFAERHGIEKTYTAMDDMLLDDDIDAVYVASPTFVHAEQSIAAMKAGKHVLCEKMIASDSRELSKMLEASRENGRILLEAMRPDFDGSYEVVSENLRKIGRIRRVSFVFSQYSSRYDRFKAGEILNAFDPKIKNSALSDIGIYPLHTCISHFGKPDEICSKSVFLENGFEGAGTVLMKYDGMIASISYSKIADGVIPSVIEGELGSITIDKMNAPSKIELILRGDQPKLIPFAPPANNMSCEIEAFRDIINGKRSADRYLKVTSDTMDIVELINENSEIIKK